MAGIGRKWLEKGLKLHGLITGNCWKGQEIAANGCKWF